MACDPPCRLGLHRLLSACRPGSASDRLGKHRARGAGGQAVPGDAWTDDLDRLCGHGDLPPDRLSPRQCDRFVTETLLGRAARLRTVAVLDLSAGTDQR